MVKQIVIGLTVVSALGAAFAFDRSAVTKLTRERAISQCGQEYDLSATRAELDALRAQIATESVAKQHLQEKIQVARGEAMRLAVELEAYERENEIDPDGVVGADLLRRLRSN